MCGGGGSRHGIAREYRESRSHHADEDYLAIKHDLKAMYARGEIDEPTYRRLKHLAKEGELGWDDLRRLWRDRTSARAMREGPTELPVVEPSAMAPQTDTEPMEWIRRRTEQLQEAEAESNALLREVEAKVVDLRSRLGKMEESADAAPTAHEGVSQAEVERKLALQQQISALESRTRELREDLQRIDSLRAQLALREQEIKVAESRRRVAAIEDAIRGEQPAGPSP